MKTMKKLLALIMALTMVFALAATAFAEDVPPATSGTITVTNPNVGETYSIYKIFDLTYAGANDDQAAAFTYTVRYDTAWEDFKDWTLSTDTTNAEKVSKYLDFEDVGDKVTVVKLNETYSANDTTTAEAGKALAKLAADYLAEYTSTNPAMQTAADDIEAETAETSVAWTGLGLGYYFVTTTTGTVCSLDTNHENVSITDKNDPHEDIKKIFTNNIPKGVDGESIGDTIPFRVTLTVKPGAKGLVMHDRMDAGLTPVLATDSTLIDVTIYEGEDNDLNNQKVLDASQYTVAMVGEDDSVCTDETEKCTFHITFTQNYLDSIDKSTTLYVHYAAVLNEGAVMYNEANENESKLTWGEGSKTVWSEADVYTFEISVFKYTGDLEDEYTALEGAEFTLYNNKKVENVDTMDTAKAVNVVKGTDVTSTEQGYKVCTKDDGSSYSHVTTITTNASGKFNIEGLAPGVYWLKETKAPDGYNLLKDPIKIIITAVDENEETTDDGKVYYVMASEGDEGKTVWNDESKVEAGNVAGGQVNAINVLNNSGTELPSTGGMGTTLFYVIGSIMMVGAAVLLISKKRMSV